MTREAGPEQDDGGRVPLRESERWSYRGCTLESPRKGRGELRAVEIPVILML